MSYFSGRVDSVVFSNPADAFYILRMTLDTDNPDLPGIGKPASVRGYVPGIPVQAGSWFGFEGDWTRHAKFGKQIAITKAPVLKDGWDPDIIEKMLIANGIGERSCWQIRKFFGDADFAKNLGDEVKLKEVPGVDTFMAKLVVQRWQSVVANFKSLEFLSDLGLPAAVVNRAWAIFDEKAEEILSTNPWALVQVQGITFSQADEVAHRLGLPDDSPGKTRGAVLFICKDNRNFGHTYLTTGQVLEGVQAYIPEATAQDVVPPLVELNKEKLLVLDRTTRAKTTGVYEPWAHYMESEAARMMKEREGTAFFGAPGKDTSEYIQALCSMGPATQEAAKGGDLGEIVDAAIEEWGQGAKLQLSDNQKRGVANALKAPVSILTGLPGTGKTTSLKAAVRVLQEAGISFLLCAPTGIAAKNLSQRTGGAEASTIHRAFSAKGYSNDKRDTTYAGIVGKTELSQSSGGEGEIWGYDQKHPFPAEVVMVDEASMVDQHLLYRLLDCTSPQCRLVLIGDAAQLPSVGPGNVLRDLIATGRFPVVNLTEIFRQEDTSDIVFAAHAIHRGEVPVADSKEFKLIEVDNEEIVRDYILKLAKKLYSKRVNFQILSPRHAGVVGVTSLNARLRELLNPKSPGLSEVRLGKDSIREGDRVMIIKNNYRLEVFNGDVGKVTQIQHRAKSIEIKIHGNPPKVVPITFKEAPRLIRLAYACTVHKAQGLEYDCIVIPIVMGFRHQLQRNLYYTAITRARKKVILVGQRQALARAVHNDWEDLRNTMLRERLE